MKRIHLFEFEDQPWFPNWIRTCITRYIVTIHKLLGSAEVLADLIARALKHASSPRVVDLCSGSGGPLMDVIPILKEKHGVEGLSITFTDLYPNLAAARAINGQGMPGVSYLTTPVDAARLGTDQPGVRSMVCSMHHMKPEVARSILQDARDARQPICIFEISDNSQPLWTLLISVPLNIIMVLLVTPWVRPMSWRQLVFTYLIPILPLVIAWDGAVSNVRTYTLEDMGELLKGLESPDYLWEKGLIEGRGKKLYLLGLPVEQS